MKNIKILIIITGWLVVVSLISSCDKGFTDMNTNKIDPTSLNPELVMNNAIIYAVISTRGAHLCYMYPIVQQIQTPFGSSLLGGAYNQLSTGNATAVWTDFYPNVVKTIVDVVAKAKLDQTKQNFYNTARIFKVYVFQVLTDCYGDIPYTDAGKGFLEGIPNPKYDTQQVIYNDLLKELDEASSALTTTLPLSANDILYGGDVTKWKRLGYSLMLRAAMRLSKVDPAKAQVYVAKAIAGGLMQANSDNAVMRHDATYTNPVGVQLTGTEKANYYLCKPFVDYLKSKNNPILPVIAQRFVGATDAPLQTASRASSDPAKQIGMPMGYDNTSIKTRYVADGVSSLYDYSVPNANTVVNYTSPEFYVTYSQTQFLLAEAVIRGWATGNASAIFSNAIKAYMDQLATYGTNAVVPSASITAYVTANPLVAGTELNQINTEYWVASFLNGPELWSNWRRSGYPVLTPNPYPGSEVPGAFIRRFVYPDSEFQVNKTNIEEAIARQGANLLSTRVWWDKP